MPRQPSQNVFRVTIGEDVHYVEAFDASEARSVVTGRMTEQPKFFSVEQLSQKERVEYLQSLQKQEVDLREVVQKTEKPTPESKKPSKNAGKSKD